MYILRVKCSSCNSTHAIKEQYHFITGKMVYHKLVEEGYIKSFNVFLASIYRYIRDNNLKRNQCKKDFV